MIRQSLKLLQCLFVIFSFAPSTGYAFEITTSFSHEVEPNRSGGGGCPSTLIGQGTKVVNGLRVIDKVFLRDDCLERTIRISIDGSVYELDAVGDTRERAIDGFFQRYENSRLDVKVAIKNTEILQPFYDPESECHGSFRKVILTVYFKGKKKRVTALVAPLCP